MTIRINIRQLGRKRDRIGAVPFGLPGRPATVRELIIAVARGCVGAYNERVRQGETVIRPMAPEALSGMETIGKLAFGVNYGGREADEAAAIVNALQGFEDGLYRVFHGQEELTELDAPITLAEGDEMTFIRLTMLSGSIF